LDYRIIYINAECIFAAILIILYFLERSSRKGHMSIRHQLLYILFTITIILDSMWILVDGRPELRSINMLINLIYLSITSMIGYLWLLYTLEMFPSKTWVKKAAPFLAIPVVLDILLVLSSPVTGLVFSIDEGGHYVRHSLHIISFIINYTYVLLGSYVALRARKEATLTADKRRFGVAALFAVPIVVLTAIQLALPPGLPAMQGGVIIALLLVYAMNQNVLITKDDLTGLLNRYAFEQELMDRISNYDDNDNNLYLMEGILDGFKEINDTYGLPMGDRILVIVSEILKDVFSEYGSLVFRTGGNIFMMIVETAGEIDRDAIRDEINSRLKEKGDYLKIDLRMSMGAGKYTVVDDFKTIIERVDQDLYKHKAPEEIAEKVDEDEF
jgi:diguanylate cyclase (GGDEF)-like protein